VALVPFMVRLDVTAVNVALPRIQQDLGVTHSGPRPWGQRLPTEVWVFFLRGRLANLLHRRRLFLVGMAIFAVGSVMCVGPAGLGLVLWVQPREHGKKQASYAGKRSP
jgi:MFS family permease